MKIKIFKIFTDTKCNFYILYIKNSFSITLFNNNKKVFRDENLFSLFFHQNEISKIIVFSWKYKLITYFQFSVRLELLLYIKNILCRVYCQISKFAQSNLFLKNWYPIHLTMKRKVFTFSTFRYSSILLQPLSML